MAMSAWIRYFFKVDAFELSDLDFAIAWKQANYLLKMLKPINAE